MLVCLAVHIPQAWAAGVDVAAEGETRTASCAGGNATLSGSRNTVTFTGVCTSLTVRGDANKVSAGFAARAAIDIEGNGNQLRIAAGKPASLRVSGSNTILVAAGGSAPPADAATLSGDAQNIELDCTNRAVNLEANRSRIVLQGGCSSVVIRGAWNRVEAELAPNAAVRIEGDGTILTYHVRGAGAPPVATVLGVGSLLEMDSQVAQLQAPAAPPAGITRVPLLMHDLQGTVTLDGTLVRLPADLFAGAAMGSNGEAAMGRLGELIGLIRPRGVRIAAVDPADVTLAAQRAKAVQAWLGQHGAGSVPSESGGVRGGAALVEVMLLR
jgi:hypothetical protein